MIVEIVESGLEGVGYPVVLSPSASAKLIAPRRATPEDFLAQAEKQFRSDVDRIGESVGRIGKDPEKTLSLTGAVVGNLTEEELRSLLTSPESGVGFAELDTPGELELDRGRALVGAPDVERCGLDGEGQIIAVLDGEVLPHVSLAERLTQKGNFSKHGWGEKPEHAGELFARNHATAVATIIAGDGESDTGETPFKGLCPKAHIWNYKIAPSTPRGSDVAAALEAAFRDGAKIINLSWGKKDADIDGRNLWARTVDALFERDVIVCKSVGNAGPDPSTLSAPADAHFVISVGSAELDGSGVQEGSSRGPTADGREKPELHCPGGGVVSGSFDNTFAPTSPPGTSFAAPFAAGAVALLRQRFPEATAAELRDALMSSPRRSVAGDSLQLLSIPAALQFIGSNK
ncbi:S8 family peptidase [Rhodobacteraceae bacterium MCCB 386]|nr:S8 family peptidase [Roseitranquillus sediminis]